MKNIRKEDEMEKQKKRSFFKKIKENRNKKASKKR